MTLKIEDSSYRFSQFFGVQSLKEKKWSIYTVPDEEGEVAFGFMKLTVEEKKD